MEKFEVGGKNCWVTRTKEDPYLNNQPLVIEVYDQPIITSKILTQFLNMADALVET